jgi:hypothetical protein
MRWNRSTPDRTRAPLGLHVVVCLLFLFLLGLFSLNIKPKFPINRPVQLVPTASANRLVTTYRGRRIGR